MMKTRTCGYVDAYVGNCKHVCMHARMYILCEHMRVSMIYRLQTYYRYSPSPCNHVVHLLLFDDYAKYSADAFHLLL